jgi:hypothetical protein
MNRITWCNAMSMPVDGASGEGGTVAVVSRAVQMVHCYATAWTDEREARELKVLVTRSNPVACTMVVTEKAMQRMLLTGTTTEKHYMESKWWTKLWQAKQRVQKRKSLETVRAVKRAAKRQCKKDKRQTEVLLAKDRYWNAMCGSRV